MATRILNITSSNTWGDLIRALNNAINTINDIGFNDYTKEAGTLILSQPYANTITLSVSGNTSLETTAISGNVNIGQNLILSNTSQILIGSNTNNTATILLATNVTANDSIGVSVESTLDENVTTNYTTFKSSPKITNATFTLNDLTHFNTTVTKLGSLCTIANNYGYFVGSDFAVGTNNYGFVSEIVAGANNWNIYASGTANNYIKGNLGLNTTTPSANLHIVGEQYIQASSSQTALKISQEGTGHLLHFDNSISDSSPIVITANGTYINGDVVSTKYNLPYDDTLTNYDFNYQQAGTNQLGGTAAIAYYGTKTGNQNGPALSFNRSANTTLGGHGLVGSDYTLGSIGFAGSDGSKFVMGAGIRCDVDGIPEANSVPGKLIFSTTPIGANVSIDRMIIDSNGHIGISTIPEPGKLLSINKELSGLNSCYGIVYDGEIKSDVTSYARLVHITPSVDDVAFTLNNLQYYTAEEGTFGELANVTNQYGYYVGTLTSANNNYGYYSTIDEGEGNWNFYAAGNAANYFAGDMRFDKTISSTVGNKTINKNAGSVIIQSGNTEIIVTNSRVDANSVILTTVASIDSNTKSATAVANTGFFTIYPNATPSSNTRINFVIIN